MHLTHLFDASFRGRAEAIGLEYEDSDGRLLALTFGEIDARASRMAHELTARGLRHGDRLCLHLGNCVEFIDLYLACVRLGVILVPMNVLYREREIAHIVASAEPAAIVASADDVAYPEGVAVWNVAELGDAATRQPSSRPSVTLDGGAPAMIVYTSGTTGAPKGAVLSHDALATNAIALVAIWKITHADRYLAMLPLFHLHGLGNGLHSWLIAGSRMRLLARFDQRTTPGTMAEFRPTLVLGVPTIYTRLLDPGVVSADVASRIAAHARLFVCGSAPLPRHVHETFRERYGQAILERYGMTESLIIASNPYDGDRRAGSVGVPLPGVSVRVTDEEGRVLGDGEMGELEIRSPSLLSGYWREPGATAAAFRDGWFRTGDIGSRSADGYYTLGGRRGDLIINGGFNVYPREVENVLLAHQQVREAAVVGIADSLRGEVPIAFIVCDDAIDVTEIEAWCRTQLASFKVPRAFLRVDSLPRTAVGKVQTSRLAELARELMITGRENASLFPSPTTPR